MARRRQTEGGAIAVLAAVVVMVLCGFLALSLDLGHKMNAKAQVESAVDAAAVAGARSLNGTAAGIIAAHADAHEFAVRHLIDTTAVTIGANAGNAAGGDIVAGFWDAASRTFYTDNQTFTLGDGAVQLSQTGTPQYYNALKVIGGADGASGHNDPLDVFFGSVIGLAKTLSVTSSTVAVGGGPCDENNNVLPLMVPSCAITNETGDTVCNQPVTVSFNWGTGADVAFADTTLDDGSNFVGNDEALDQIAAAVAQLSPNTLTFHPMAITDGLGGGAARDGLPFPASTIAAIPSSGLWVILIANVGNICTTRMPAHTTPVGFAQVAISNVNPTTRTITITPNCGGTSNHRGGCALFGLPSQFLPTIAK